MSEIRPDLAIYVPRFATVARRIKDLVGNCYTGYENVLEDLNYLDRYVYFNAPEQDEDWCSDLQSLLNYAICSTKEKLEND